MLRIQKLRDETLKVGPRFDLVSSERLGWRKQSLKRDICEIVVEYNDEQDRDSNE
jgi:hypothetical protein